MENVSKNADRSSMRAAKKRVMPRDLLKMGAELPMASEHFHLRHSITFSNGTMFGAKDIKHSFSAS
jgi:hypothetical protein